MSETLSLSPAVEERIGYLLAEYEETRRRLREAQARVAAGERLGYLVEAESIGITLVRRDLRALGVDTAALFR